MQPHTQQQSIGQPQNGNFLPNSLLTGQLGNNLQPQQQQQPQFPQQMPDFSANLLGMPSIPGPHPVSGQQGLFQTGSPNQNQPESGGSDLSFEHDDQFADLNTGSSNGRRTNSKLHARETKTKRNPKQQMQNKQAQQRYRCCFFAKGGYMSFAALQVCIWCNTIHVFRQCNLLANSIAMLKIALELSA